MTKENRLLMNEAKDARIAYKAGHLNYANAIELIIPYIVAVNTMARKLAKKHNECYVPVTIDEFMRTNI